MKQDSVEANPAHHVSFTMAPQDEGHHGGLTARTNKGGKNRNKNHSEETGDNSIAEPHRSFVNRDASPTNRDEILTCDESKGESILSISTITSKDVGPHHSNKRK
jgi:hypothetical protein